MLSLSPASLTDKSGPIWLKMVTPWVTTSSPSGHCMIWHQGQDLALTAEVSHSTEKVVIPAVLKNLVTEYCNCHKEKDASLPTFLPCLTKDQLLNSWQIEELPRHTTFIILDCEDHPSSNTWFLHLNSWMRADLPDLSATQRPRFSCWEMDRWRETSREALFLNGVFTKASFQVHFTHLSALNMTNFTLCYSFLYTSLSANHSYANILLRIAHTCITGSIYNILLKWEVTLRQWYTLPHPLITCICNQNSTANQLNTTSAKWILLFQPLLSDWIHHYIRKQNRNAYIGLPTAIARSKSSCWGCTGTSWLWRFLGLAH